MTGRRVHAADLTLLGRSRLSLPPKSTVSCGKTPGVNLASGKERIDCLIHYAVQLDRRDPL